jgi:WD40 repeat protein
VDTDDWLNEFESLPADARERIGQACARFEAALGRGEPARAEDYLGTPGPGEAVLLRELLLIECEVRLRRGIPVTGAELTARFPGCAHLVAGLPALAARHATAPAGGLLLPDGSPAVVGYYRLVRELGRGGFGIVFLTVDARTDTEVAVKIPHPTVLLTPGLRECFVREARAVAALDHPHIVRVVDSGDVGLVCYLATEYVPGPSLARWLAERADPVPPRVAAELLRVLAGAVQHAHDRGILHRDLKPANVLLAGGDPRAPRLTDFGLARLADAPDLSQSGLAVGTPAYMAPEQAAGRRRDVSPRTDVYALGAILYELITCEPPFAGRTLDVLRRVTSDDPVRPSARSPDVPPELEAVCLKCLEKSPARRYATAAELADDLVRFLAGRPTRARLPGTCRRVARWCRRHPLRATAAGFSTLTAVVVVVVVATAGARLAEKNRELSAALVEIDGKNRELAAEAQDRAERAKGLRRRAYADDIRRAEVLLARNDLAGFRRVMDRCRPEPGEEELRGFEWHYLDGLAGPAPHRVLTHTAKAVYGLALRPDGRVLATAGQDGAVRLLDPETGRDVGPPLAHPHEVNQVAYSADGSRLATACDDGAVRIWSPAGGPPVVLGRHEKKALAVAFAPDGGRVASGGQDNCLRIWDLRNGVPGGPIVVRSDGHVQTVAWSPDGQRLVTGEGESPTGTVKVRDASGRVLAALPIKRAVHNLAVGVGGTRIITSDGDGGVTVWDHRPGPASDGWSPSIRLGDTGDDRICDLALNHDGSRVVLARETAVEVWRLDPPRREAMFRGHEGRVWAACFAPGQADVISAGADRTVRRWDLAADAARRTPLSIAGRAYGLAFDDSGSRLAVRARGSEWLKVWRLDAHGSEIQVWVGIPATVGPPGFDRSGRLFTIGMDGTLCRWEPEHNAVPAGIATLAGLPTGPAGQRWSPDQSALGPGGRPVAYDGAAIRLWDQETGRLLRSVPCRQTVACLGFGSGYHLAAGCTDRKVRIWDTREDEFGRTIDCDPDRPVVVAVGGEADWLACGSSGAIRLWSLVDGAERPRLVGHRGPVRALAFTPDGRTLASCGADGTFRLWHVETGTEMLTFAETGRDCRALAFSPDGRLLATASWYGSESEVVLRVGGPGSPARP